MIKKRCNSFIWVGARDTKAKPRIAWDKLCQPKKLGGLNLCNLQLWNDIALLKSLWALASKKDKLWIK